MVHACNDFVPNIEIYLLYYGYVLPFIDQNISRCNGLLITHQSAKCASKEGLLLNQR